MNRLAARVVLILCSATIAAPVYAEDPQILFPGGAQDVDIPDYEASSKDINYLGLHKVDGRYLLAKTTVSYASGAISSSLDNPIAYIRSKTLHEGEVLPANVHWNDKNLLPFASETKIQISLKGQDYYLFEDKSSYFLIGAEGSSELYPGRDDLRIMWAGDLDGDGRLDLIINSDGDEGKNSISCLLLSSLAKKPRLLEEVACQFYSG